jgi:hypothetical protein
LKPRKRPEARKRSDGWSFACVPDRVADRPDCTPCRLAVARAVFRDAGPKGYSTATREELAADAKVSVGVVSEAASWLIEAGELATSPDEDARSGRRLVVLRPVRPDEALVANPTSWSHKHAGAHQDARGVPPGRKGARARTQGGARQAALPLKEEEIREEKERETSRPVPPDLPAPGAIAAAPPETRRDGFAPLGGGETDEARAEPAAVPTPAEFASAIAEREATVRRLLDRAGGDPKRMVGPSWQFNRPLYEVALAELIRLRADDPGPILAERPAAPAAPPPPTPASPRAAPRPALLDAESRRLLGLGPAGAGSLSLRLAAALGEPDNGTTIRLLCDAATLLPPGFLGPIFEQAAAPGVRDPKLWLSSVLTPHVAAKRRSLSPNGGAPCPS